MNANRKSSFIIALFLNMLFVHIADRALAQGNLLVTPRRIVFEGGRRTQELSLANSGNDTARYSVSVVNMRMKEDGSFEQITQPDSGQNFASNNIRVFPRIIMLGPDEGQTIKVQLVTGANGKSLAPGEYRSFIYFKALPKQQMSKRLDKMVTNLSVRLIPVIGIAVPVIVRVGESNTTLSISDLALQYAGANGHVLVGQFNRAGNMSVYGDISVDFISNETNTTTHVGVIKGLSIYTPNKIRKFQMELDDQGKVNYHNGKLHVTFTVHDNNNRPKKIAEEDLILP